MARLLPPCHVVCMHHETVLSAFACAWCLSLELATTDISLMPGSVQGPKCTRLYMTMPTPLAALRSQLALTLGMPGSLP